MTKNVQKIVILMEYRLSSRDYERFGVHILQTEGFQVEVFELFNLVSGIEESSAPARTPAEAAIVKSFANRTELYRAIRNEPKSTCFLTFVGVRGNTWSLYRLLSKHKGLIGLASLGPILFEPVVKVSLLRALKKLVLAPDQFWFHFSKRIPPRHLGIRSVDFVLSGGEAVTRHSHPLIGDSTKFIKAHSFDYDRYLELRERLNQNITNERPYAVFLDELMANHPDFELLRVPHAVTEETYNKEIEGFLTHIHGKFGKVVVAAHPRSPLPEHSTVNGIEYIKGKTIELVSQADIVFAHCSTSIKFAVLFNKTLHFLMTDELLANRFHGKVILQNAEFLGAPWINVSNSAGISKFNPELKPSEKNYEKYRRLYIKCPGTPDIPAWKIFAGAMKGWNS